MRPDPSAARSARLPNARTAPAAGRLQAPGQGIVAGEVSSWPCHAPLSDIEYSYLRAGSSANNTVSSANLNGWNASVEFKLLPWIGGVADFGGNYGTERVPLICPTFPSCPVISLSASDHTFLFGPRVSVSL